MKPMGKLSEEEVLVQGVNGIERHKCTTVQMSVPAVDEYLLYEPVSEPVETREGSLLQTLQETMGPNPYAILSLLGPQRTVYTILDLKDAYFCISLARESQPLRCF